MTAGPSPFEARFRSHFRVTDKSHGVVCNTVTCPFPPHSVLLSRADMIRAALIAILSLAFAAPALAHPHVWVTMHSELVYGADGAITGIHHEWAFDDMFSAFATQGLASKVKGQFTREELSAARQGQCRVAEGIRLFHLRHRRREESGAHRPGAGLLARLHQPDPDAALHAAVQDAGEGEAPEGRSLRPDHLCRFRMGQGQAGARRQFSRTAASSTWCCRAR